MPDLARLIDSTTGQSYFGASGGASGAWPIGSIFLSVSSTNPGTSLGFGTWVAFGTGRTLIAIDTGDSDFDAAEKTGGSKTHTLIEAELPAHTHGVDVPSSSGGGSGPYGYDNNSTVGTGGTSGSAGSGIAHANVQPYIVVYMWKRTV